MKWLNQKRRRQSMSLQGDLPPVAIFESLDIGLPKLHGAHISAFRNTVESVYSSVHGMLSPDRRHLELVMVSSLLSAHENAA